MSVIVKGMEMPECCAYCEIQYDGVCQMNTVESIDDIAYDGRPEWCPLVELPEHHGDLIDRDAVKQAVYHHLSIKGEENLLPAEKSVFGNIIKAPSIIEAEGAEE